MKTPLRRQVMNFDGITELTEGGVFDRRNMKADEGDRFRQGPRGCLPNSSRPRLGCKSLSPTPTHGGVYLRNSQRVGGDGEKVDFFSDTARGRTAPANQLLLLFYPPDFSRFAKAQASVIAIFAIDK